MEKVEFKQKDYHESHILAGKGFEKDDGGGNLDGTGYCAGNSHGATSYYATLSLFNNEGNQTGQVLCCGVGDGHGGFRL